MAAGSRDDWRGIVAYGCTPERWRPVPYGILVVNVVGLVTGSVVGALDGPLPVLRIAVTAPLLSWMVLRPFLGVVRRRADLRRTSTRLGA